MVPHRAHQLHPSISRDILAALVGFTLLAVACAIWYGRLSQRDRALSAEVGQLEVQWKAVSRDLGDADRVRAHAATIVNAASRLAKENHRGEWTPVIRSIALSAGPGIDLRVIHLWKTWKTPDKPQGYLLRIEGFSTGVEPRSVADDFSHKLGSELGRSFQTGKGCKFERLDDQPNAVAANPGDQTAAFTIVVSIVPPETARPSDPSKN